MNPQIQTLLNQFFQETATKGAELVVAASKHTGIFVSFYDVGTALSSTVNVLKGFFK